VTEEALFDLPPAELGLEEQEEDLFGLGEGAQPQPQAAAEQPSESADPQPGAPPAADPAEGAGTEVRPRGFRGWLARLFGSES
jgi:hypothetical protein